MNTFMTSQGLAMAQFIAKGKRLDPDVAAVYNLYQAGWFDQNRKAIKRKMAKIVDTTDVITVGGMINKLCVQLSAKMPRMECSDPLINFDYWQEKARTTAAAWIVQSYIDEGVFTVQKKQNMVWDANLQAMVPHTILEFELGGTRRKGMFRGIHFDTKGLPLMTNSSGRFKYSSNERTFLKDLREIPFRLDPWVTEKYLHFAASLADDWNRTTDKNGNPLSEAPVNKQERILGGLSVLMELEGRTWYEESRFINSGRHEYVNYDYGKSLHGRTWEILNVEFAEPSHITEAGVRALKHKLYALIYDERLPEDRALEALSDEAIEACRSINIWDSQDQEELGRNRYILKILDALDAAAAGVPSHMMVDYDFTTSGILMPALAFSSPEFAELSNLLPGSDRIYSAHSEISARTGIEGLTTKQIKKAFTMGVLHGETLKTSVGNLAKLGIETTEEELKEALVKALGDCALNIFSIADWGVKAVKNERTTLSWTMPDGFKASHFAHYQAARVTVYAPTMSTEQLYQKYTVIKDMPLWKPSGDKEGSFLPKTSAIEGRSKPLVSKVRGLYAVMTHGIDGYVLRSVVRGLREVGVPVVLKHDCFFVPPAYVLLLKDLVQEVLAGIHGNNLYLKGIEEIARNIPDNRGIPDLVMQEGDLPNTVFESTNYLMP